MYLGCRVVILKGSRKMETKTFRVAILFATCVAMGANWSNWRGPSYNGSTNETNLPVKWSRTENIAWSADLPGASAATPIVHDDHVFISSTDVEQQTVNALCFDRKTGELQWQHDIAKGVRRDTRTSFASPSPVTDGHVVIFLYGNGDLIGFDFDGQQLWERNIQDDYGVFAFNWTFSTSPLLYDGRLYLQVLQRDVPVDGRGFVDRKNESYLLAMDPHTGETLWQAPRPCQARMESREAFSTPIPYRHDGRTEILVVGGDDITGHDPETGSELWRWGTWNPGRITHWRLVPSPVAGKGIILACAPKNDPIYAIRAGGEGILDDTAIAWASHESKTVTSDVPTPAYYDDDFFVLSDLRKTLTRVDPSTGQVKWKVRTPGLKKYEASPLAADGKIYLMNFIGDVVIVDADSGQLINQGISMDDPAEDPVRSCVVASQGNLFVRTNRNLYCVGE